MRRAIESLYIGKCTVTVQEESINEETGESIFTEEEKLADIPCRLSFSSTPNGTRDGFATDISQTVKLFIAPELDIPNGSKITVTQNGRTTDYCRSGESAVYTSHQEITLDLFEEYA